MSVKVKKFLCAFCRSERTLRDQKHITFFEIFLSTAASIILMLIFWQNFNPKVFVIFSVIIVLFEFLVQIKKRLVHSCPHCGFDPYLYKKNPQQCAEKVKAHLELRKNNPLTLLSKKPVLDLPKIKKPSIVLDSQMKTAVAKKENNLDLRL